MLRECVNKGKLVQIMKTIIFIVVLILQTACLPTIVEETAVNTPARSEIAIVPPTSQASSLSPLWSSNPTDIILQYDVSGGLMGQGPGTSLPLWTLYGDGLVVWTEDNPATPGFTSEIWIGHLSDAEIEDLILFIEEQGFWELAPSYQPEQFIIPTIPAETNPEGFTAVQPNPEAALDQPSSSIMADVANQRHQVTLFPAEWEGAPEAYQNILEYISEIQLNDTIAFAPMTFSLRAREMPQIMADDSQMITWPYANIQLSAVANEPLSLDRDQGISIADSIMMNGQKVIQNEIVYIITLMADPPRK